jgi:ribonuclease Z
MMPLPGRWLTSLLLRYNGKMLMVDCGEGTQIPLKLAGWGFKPIDAIFFTHYHADHIAGLPGLLLTIGNSGKDTPLDLIGPPGLTRVVQSLLVICPALPFDIRATELPLPRGAPSLRGASGGAAGTGANVDGEAEADGERDGGLAPLRDVALFDSMSFQYAPADHNIPCLAYSFHIRRQGAFYPARAKELNIPLKSWSLLQAGKTVELDDGRSVTPDMVLGPERRGIKLSYCTDSRPAPALRRLFKDSALLICEGMYGDDGERENAIGKKHMIFSEAAGLARDAGVGELWLTHYSPALQNPGEHIGAARRVFPNTRAGSDLLTTKLIFPEGEGADTAR